MSTGVDPEDARFVAFACAIARTIIEPVPPPLKLRFRRGPGDPCVICGGAAATVEATFNGGLTAHAVCLACARCPKETYPQREAKAFRATLLAWAIHRAVQS